MKTIIGLLVVVWLIIGVAAAAQLGYFGDDGPGCCQTVGATKLRVLPGRLT